MIKEFIPTYGRDEVEIFSRSGNSGYDLYCFGRCFRFRFIRKESAGKDHIISIEVTECVAGQSPWLVFEGLNDLCIFGFMKMVKVFQIFYPDKNRMTLRN